MGKYDLIIEFVRGAFLTIEKSNVFMCESSIVFRCLKFGGFSFCELDLLSQILELQHLWNEAINHIVVLIPFNTIL